jgi:hypothetical protein
VALATLLFVFYAGNASAQTLEAGATITFTGQFTDPTPILVPGNDVFGCPSKAANPNGLVNCEYFTITAGATGVVTKTIDTDEGLNFVDVSIHCNGESTARAVISSNAGEPGVGTFEVVQGDVCEERVSIFMSDPLTGEATPLNPLTFTVENTLTVSVGGGGGGGGDLQPVRVTGGGQVDPNKSFTSNARPTEDGAEGTIRYFTEGCKAWSTDVISVEGAAFGEGGFVEVVVEMKVQTATGTTTETAHARFDDEGEPGSQGTDMVTIDVCDNPTANDISSGNVQIHPTNT